jgi:hypothetical protein
MKITPVHSKATNERFLKIEIGNSEDYLPFEIARICVDHRIRGFRVKCTECKNDFAVCDLNGGGWCEKCAV